MKIFATVFMLGLFCAATAFAGIVTKQVRYKDGEVELQGTMVYDQSISSLRPGVLLIPEWWGHNAYIQRRARQMAEWGFVAFAVDMYGVGKVTEDPKIAGEWSAPFYENRIMMRDRARAGLSVLQNQINVDKSKIAAIGFCMGGTVALELARDGEKLAGVAAFHAGLDFPSTPSQGSIPAKLLVMNGAADPFVPFESRNKFIRDMNDAKADLEFIEYSGAVHAFTNPKADQFKANGLDGVGYDPTAERRSFQSLRGFFKEIFGITPRDR